MQSSFSIEKTIESEAEIESSELTQEKINHVPLSILVSSEVDKKMLCLNRSPNSERKSDLEVTLQGVRGQSGFFNWALREINTQVRLYLKVVLKS